MSDIAKARQFYEEFLGYAELPNPPQSADAPSAVVKINDDQYVELDAGAGRGEGQLNHIALSTDDARMRDYLASQGVQGISKIAKDGMGNTSFSIQDPDGHLVEFVEYRPGAGVRKFAGKFMPESRISTRLYHTGILVGDLDKAMKFYAGILRFREFWRGSRSGQVLSWVNMRVPDSDDYIEFMLYSKLPAPNGRGSSHHICMLVPDMQRAAAEHAHGTDGTKHH